MAQDKKKLNENLKAILGGLNTENAKKVLQELDQPKPSVKKQLLYELIAEIQNLTVDQSKNQEFLQNQLREKDHIIELNQKYIENLKAYAANLENQQNQHIELFFLSMKQSLQKDLMNIQQIQAQSQEFTQFIKLQQEYEEQQKKLFDIKIIQVNQMDALANRAQDDRESQERIIQQIEVVITKSEKFLKSGIELQNSSPFQKLEQVIQDNIKKLLQMIQINQSYFIKLKVILSDQLKQLTNYTNINQHLIKQIEIINKEVNNINEINRVEREKFKVQMDNMKSILKKQENERTKQILKNEKLLELITTKFEDLQNGLKSQLYIFNQAIIKGIIEQQTYFLIKDSQIIRQSIQPGDLQKLQKIKVPANITELQQQLDQMREYHILEPAKEQLKSFGDFAKKLEEQINNFLI